MAKINQVKLRQEADAAERAGRFDKAVEALKQVVQENPRDWNTINRVGDLYAKLNNVKAANEQYVKVARYFADDGFYLKAIAVWKKVLRNDASMLDGHVSLGELYAKQGLVAEAKQTYAQVYDEYVKRNKLRDAGEVLRRMAEVDPSDLKVRIRLAELYGREGSPDKAAGEYLAIADELVKKGLLAEALQLLDKALRSGQRSPRLLSAAARVHLVQKNYAASVQLLLEARRASPGDREVTLRFAEACLGARQPDEARRALEELLARDPADEDARQQLGLVWLVEGRFDEAYQQVLPAIDKLVEKRQVDRASALLQQIVQRNPSHVPSLSKLVELYRLMRNDAMVAQTYSQLVEAYLAAGALDQAASILEMLVELEPHNEQHRGKLRWLREQQDGLDSHFDLDLAQPAAPQSLAAQPAPAFVSAAPAPSPARPMEPSGPLSPDDQEFVDEHLAEGRVFRKYGLGDKARDQFEAVLNRFPDNVDALRELAELHRDRGETDAQAQRLRALAQALALKGESAKAAKVQEELVALAGAAPAPAAVAPAAPHRAEVAAPVARPAPAAVSRPPFAAAPVPAAPAEDIDVDIDVEDHQEEADVPAADDLDYVDLEAVPPAEPERASVSFDLSDLAPCGEIGGQFVDEAEPPSLEGLGEPDEPGGFDLDEPSAPPEPVPEPPRYVPPPRFEPPPFVAPAPARPTVAPAPLRAQAKPPSAPAPGGLPQELRRGLEEIESYVSMGFIDDAKGVLDELNARFAGHPLLLKRVAELGLDLPGSEPEPAHVGLDDLGLLDEPAAPPMPVDEPLQLGGDLLDLGGLSAELAAESAAGDELAGLSEPAEDEPAPPSEGLGFDLSAELGDLFGAQPAVADEPAPASGTDLGDQSLSDMFKEFQKGVDRQLGKEDYETRYNLGIAYKEMGLVDEAIAEFQLAAKDEKRMLECASMLGICFLEKGMAKLAVKWFEKGLLAPGRSDEEYQGLRYDLANAYEQAGEQARALALFTDLYGQDASFRDVADRVRRLSTRR